MSNDRRKYDRRWIERLQGLPQYRSVVEKLLQGSSLDTVAGWIMEQADRGPLSDLKRSTIRYYLNALNVRLKEIARESRKNDHTLSAQRLNQLVDEFTSAMTPGANLATRQPEPTEEEIRALQSQHLSSVVDEITSEGLVRLALKKHLSHIDRLEQWEKQSNEPLKDWAPNIHVVISATEILLKIETAQKLFEALAQTIAPAQERQLSVVAQRLAKLTAVDLNLLREAGEKYRILLKRRREEELSRSKYC